MAFDLSRYDRRFKKSSIADEWDRRETEKEGGNVCNEHERVRKNEMK
jgi:hypothetical protein